MDWQIPEYRAERLAPKASRYGVCIFVINEGERVRGQLRKMAGQSRFWDIVVADGGSTDGSLDLPFLKDMGVTALLTKTGPGKLSAQMRMALAFAMNDNYEGCVVMDGNDKDDVGALPRFIEKLEAGFDHVQGSRYVPGGKGVNTPLLRHWGVLLLHAPLISMAAGFRYTDTTNGFRAYSRKLLLDPRIQPFRDCFQRYELHYYLAIRAARLGFKVCEVPVIRSYPKGEVPSKIKGWKGNAAILQTVIDCCLRKYDPT
jgi:glycosyltransferase involved in cell wall biosynthesis